MDNLHIRFQVSQWIARELAGVIGEEQKRLLTQWRQESEEHEQEYQELLKDFREGKFRLDEPTTEAERQWKKFANSRGQKRFAYKRWLPYAAIFLLLLGGTLIWQRQHRMQSPIASEEITLAQGDVLLILSNGKRITIRDTAGISQQEATAAIQLEEKTIQYTGENTKPAAEAYNTLVIPKGGEYKVILADGSRVWLNSETEFTYPVHFTDKDRRVFLKGEAYFEVEKDTEKPFIVRTVAQVDVRVLGTRFNIASYSGEEEIVTTLAEGSVEVTAGNESVRIRPDEQLLFNKHSHTFSRRQVDANIYLAWKDGMFMFDDQPLEQIMRQLQRWYQMDVFYMNEAVKKYRFSGDLKKYDDFKKIVQMLEEVAGLQISIQNKCVVIGTK